MAPRDRQNPSDQTDDEEVQDDETVESRDGTGSEGSVGEDDREEAEDDAAFDTGEEQEAGLEEDRVARSRGDNRFQRLANENRELHRRMTEYERERRQPAQPREETDEEFSNRIALLPPDERLEARYLRSERRNDQRLAAMAFQQQEQLDRTQYETRAATDKRYSRYRDAVENLVQSERSQGRFISREVALKYLIGERVLTSSAKETSRVKERNRRAVERQTTRPPNTRGDAGRGRERDSGRTARDRRLEDMDI